MPTTPAVPELHYAAQSTAKSKSAPACVDITPAKQRLAKMEDQLRLLTAGQTGFHIMKTPNPPPSAGEGVGLTALEKPNIANTIPTSFSAVCAESQAPLPPNLATQDHLPASQPT